jgi:predicted RNase H-like nuclease (RuvC/YqgF family)
MFWPSYLVIKHPNSQQDDHAFANFNNDIVTHASEASRMRSNLTELNHKNTDLSNRNLDLKAQVKQYEEHKRNLEQGLIVANARSKEYREKLEKTMISTLPHRLAYN